MSSRLHSLIILTCLLLQSTPVRSQNLPPTEDQRLSQALKNVDAILKEWGPETGPGCAYAAARDGHTLFARAYGMADLEHNVPLTPQSVFDASSIAKQFTAAAILLLVQDGKLRLNDDIRKYLPEMPDYGTPITIRHVLNHTSGLRDWIGVEELAGHTQPRRYYNNSDVLEIAARQENLNFTPGQRWAYTNTGYILLAIIVRRVSGSSLAEFTRERLFKPLGMDSTQWSDDSRRIVKNRAIGYQRADRQKVDSGYIKPVPMGIGDQYGSGGLLTTVSDLLIWNEALDAGRLGPFVTGELQRRGVLNDGRVLGYGAGLFLPKYKGHAAVWHGGDLAGYRAELERFPESHLSIAVLCNSDEIRPRRISLSIADALLPASDLRTEPVKTENAAFTLTPERASRLAGVFIVEETGFPLVISADKGRLIVQGESLETISENRFHSKHWGDLNFKTPDLAERNIQPELEGPETLRRIDSTLPTEAQLPEFAGVYTSDEAQSAFEIVVEKGALGLKRPGSKSPAQPLKPVARDLFEIAGLPVRFNRGPDGKINSFDFTSDRVRALRFYR
jgi:CubicO group peptidase (beta-lactamase class C family)